MLHWYRVVLLGRDRRVRKLTCVGMQQTRVDSSCICRGQAGSIHSCQSQSRRSIFCAPCLLPFQICLRVEIGISRTIGSIVETSIEAVKPFLRRFDKVVTDRGILRSLIVPPKVMLIIDVALRLLNKVFIAL